MAFVGGPFGLPVSSSAVSALGVVATSGFKSNLAASLSRGGDIIVDADSIFSGRGDDWNNSVQNRLRLALTKLFQNSGYESGYGYFPAGDQWSVGSNTPTWFHQKTFTGTPVQPNYFQGVTSRSNGANSQCRFSFPAIMTDTSGGSYPIKKIELIISSIAPESTAPSITVDIYATAAPLAAGAALITAGTATGITYNGLTGITRTITPGNINNGGEYRCGVENITFDGSTHCPVLQVTTSSDCEVVGVILYNNDWDIEGKGVRFHDRCISGAQLLPNRSTQTSGSPDWTASNYAGFMTRYRSWANPYGFSGVSSANGVCLGPSCNGKLFIIAKGINDQLLNGNTPSAFEAYYMDTIDAILNANNQACIVLVQDYCPASICAAWRTGYDSGGAGNKTHVICTWTAYNAVLYACQAKYPNNVSVVSLDRLLGETTYANAITARGWGQGDQIHWNNGGPAWAVSQIMSVMPSAKSTFGLATGLGSGTWANALHAIRFDRLQVLQNFGTLGGTYTISASGYTGNPGTLPARSSDNLSITFNLGTQVGGCDYTYSSTVTRDQGNFTIMIRMFVNATPIAGKQYINDLYGDEGGTGVTDGIRLGGDGTLAHALRFMHVNGNTYASADAVVGQWNTFVVQNSGGTLSYRVNGSAAGTATYSTPAATASSLQIGNFTAPARPIEVGSKLSHIVHMPSAISLVDIQAWETNPDIAFTLS